MKSLVTYCCFINFLLLFCFIINCQLSNDGNDLKEGKCLQNQDKINDFYSCVENLCILNKKIYPMRCTTISQIPKIFNEPLPYKVIKNNFCNNDNDCLILNIKNNWNCCYENFCKYLNQLKENIDYNVNDFISINKDSYYNYQFQICKYDIYKCKNNLFYCKENYDKLITKNNDLYFSKNILLKPICKNQKCNFYNSKNNLDLFLNFKNLIIILILIIFLSFTIYLFIFKSEWSDLKFLKTRSLSPIIYTKRGASINKENIPLKSNLKDEDDDV
ncbi:hypothetical protein ABK040_001985 [Willaertia magna]